MSLETMLKEIVEICDDAPAPVTDVTLANVQRVLHDFDERMGRIRSWAQDSLDVVTETPHLHVAGTTIGRHIDECAKCGHDIRARIHDVEWDKNGRPVYRVRRGVGP